MNAFNCRRYSPSLSEMVSRPIRRSFVHSGFNNMSHGVVSLHVKYNRFNRKRNTKRSIRWVGQRIKKESSSFDLLSFDLRLQTWTVTVRGSSRVSWKGRITIPNTHQAPRYTRHPKKKLKRPFYQQIDRKTETIRQSWECFLLFVFFFPSYPRRRPRSDAFLFPGRWRRWNASPPSPSTSSLSFYSDQLLLLLMLFAYHLPHPSLLGFSFTHFPVISPWCHVISRFNPSSIRDHEWNRLLLLDCGMAKSEIRGWNNRSEMQRRQIASKV